MPEWSFEVLDKMSNPMQVMETHLLRLEQEMGKATAAHDKLEHSSHKLASAHEHVHKSGSPLAKLFSGEAFFAVEMAEKLAELTEKVFEFGKELIEAGIEATEFKKSTIATFDLMLNGKDAAIEEFETLGSMARRSAMLKGEIVDQYKTLFSFTDRFGVEATENVIAAASDIQKALGTNAQQAFVGVMRNIEALGGLNERTIRMLKQTGVVTPQRVYEALAGELHTTVQGAKGLIKAGRISQEQSINTLLELVNQRVDKGKGLGAYTVERSAASVKDQLKNVREAWEELFDSVDTEPIAKALTNIAELLREGSPAGDKLREVLHEAFTDITKVIEFAGEHAEGFASTMETILHAAEAVGGFLSEHPVLSKMLTGAAIGGAAGGGLGALFGAAGGLGWGGTEAVLNPTLAAANEENKKTQSDIDAMNREIDELESKLNQKLLSNEQLEDKMQRAGVDAGQGFMLGLSDKIQAGDVSHLIQTQVTAAIDHALDAHSPSRVLHKRGQWAAEGMIGGWDDVMTGPRGFGAGFRASIGGSAPTPVFSPSFSPPPGGGGARSVAAEVSVKVEFGGSAPTNPQQLADMSAHIEAATERGVLKALESLGVQN